MEKQIEELKKLATKMGVSIKSGVGQVEGFMKKHKVLSGIVLGILVFLLLRKKDDND